MSVVPVQLMSDAGVGESIPQVPETRFGRWFLGTKIWLRYVVEASVEQFVQLLPPSMPEPRIILDAGCGAGTALRLLDQTFHPELIVAVDVDPAEIERCSGQVHGCACAVQLHTGDAANLELADGSLDIVFCHQTLHHTVQQKAVLREFHRVLAPGGWLLLAESCRSFIRSTPVRVLFRHPDESQKSAAEYQDMVREAGFEFEPAQVKVSSPFWSLPDWGLAERLGWRSSRNAEPTQVTLVATKSQRRLSTE